jgi:hypothetical protein
LMGKALQGPVDLGSGHQLTLFNNSHIGVMLTQVGERIGVTSHAHAEEGICEGKMRAC